MRNRAPTLLALCLAPLVLTMAGCDESADDLVQNQPPFVQFTSGPTRIEGNRSHYSFETHWTGWDYDGEMEHYQYCLDPNTDPLEPVFSFDEVNYPSHHFGAPVRVGRGFGDFADTLVYGKEVDGVLHTFAWIQTTASHHVFDLKTPIADGDTSQASPGAFEYIGRHSLFIRGIDDDGAVSPMDYLSAEIQEPEAGFLVVNTAPESKIIAPATTSGAVSGSSKITIQWEGHDPDTRDVDKKPTAYMWKIIDVPSTWEADFIEPNFVMYRHEDYKDIPWNYIHGDTTQLTMILGDGRKYIFAVRAIDEAGATEAHLSLARGGTRGGNSLFIQVNNASRPEVSATESSLGSVNSRTVQRIIHKVPINSCLRFFWTADASGYGGRVVATNYGLNIKDLDDHSPGSGWAGWQDYDAQWVEANGPYTTFGPLCMTEPGLQIFYIKARDEAGGSTVISYQFNVIDFTKHLPILYVDDWTDFSTSVKDQEHDQFWLDIILNSGRFQENLITPSQAKFDAWGPLEIDKFGSAIPLDVLSKYQILLWETNVGSNAQTAMSQSGPYLRHVGRYLREGGQLLYFGTRTIAQALGNGRGEQGIVYPFNLAPGTFPYEYLNLFTSAAGNCLKNHGGFRDGFRETLYYVEPMDPQTNLSRMHLDPEKSNLQLGYGRNWDFLQDAISEPPWFAGTIDSVYRGHTVGKHLNDKASVLDGEICGLRVSWDQAAPGNRTQGRFMWFGFPMYYFYQDEVQETMNAAFDWFLEESQQ